MRTTHTPSRSVRSQTRIDRLIIGAAALGISALGCGGNVGGGPGDDPMDMTDANPPDAPSNNTPDAAVADAAPPDAPPGPAPRAGTMTITDTEVTNPGADASGADIAIRYDDLSTAITAPFFPQPSDPTLIYTLGNNECVVYIYVIGATSEATAVDEGEVTIADAFSSNATCAFRDQRYECAFAVDQDVAGTVTVTAGSDDATINWPAEDSPFQDLDVDGAVLELSGFTEAENNGRFPILAKIDDRTVRVANPDATAAAAAASVSYSLLVGLGPNAAQAPFLDGSSEVTLSKANTGTTPALAATTVDAAGEGLALLAGSAQPHSFPGQGAVVFSCSDGDSDSCGSTPAAEEPVLIVSGRTTDTAIPNGAALSAMPAATSRFAVFECRSAPGDGAITVPNDIRDAMFSTSPTRIETRVMRVSETGTAPDLRIRVGHALVGYTDF